MDWYINDQNVDLFYREYFIMMYSTKQDYRSHHMSIDTIFFHELPCSDMLLCLLLHAYNIDKSERMEEEMVGGCCSLCGPPIAMKAVTRQQQISGEETICYRSV